MRRAVLVPLVILISYLVIELFAFGAFWILEGKPFSFARLSARRQALVEREVELPQRAGRVHELWQWWRIRNFIPHPFLGAIPHPGKRPFYRWWFRRIQDNSLDEPDTVYVAVTGGSVAESLLHSGWPTLQNKLQEIPGFREKRLQLIDLSSAGEKQPQQLMAVNYLLALGGRIDVLINLDGFNEIGPELLTNFNYGIFPAYPWTWVPLTMEQTSQADLDRLGDIHAWRRLRTALAIGIDPVGFSVTANLIWRSVDKTLERAEYRAQEARISQAELPLASRGPRFKGDVDDALAFSVEIWSNASLSLQHLAAGHGYAYFHFLQPNQYVEGSKPFTQHEESKHRQRADISAVVSRWYPVLRERGFELNRQGVRFHDLTGVFANETGEIYKDECCHLLEEGDRILASRIGDIIVTSLSSQPPER